MSSGDGPGSMCTTAGHEDELAIGTVRLAEDDGVYPYCGPCIDLLRDGWNKVVRMWRNDIDLASLDDLLDDLAEAVGTQMMREPWQERDDDCRFITRCTVRVLRDWWHVFGPLITPAQASAATEGGEG